MGSPKSLITQKNKADIATNTTGLAAHIADTADAHDASAISVLDAGGLYTATEVESALAEIAGAGRSAETVKANATNISNLSSGIAATTVDSVGTIEVVSGLTATEYGDGAVHKTILDLSAVEMTVTDGTTPATDGAWGTLKLYTLPTGYAKIIGASAGFATGGIVASSGGSGLTATADFELGVGSVASANDSSFGLGDGTQEDIVAALDVDLVASASDADENGYNATSAGYDGTSTAQAIYLNMRTLDDADSGTDPSTLTLTGKVTIVWTMLGEDQV